MAKDFFQDMIKMKSELRKEMEQKEASKMNAREVREFKDAGREVRENRSTRQEVLEEQVLQPATAHTKVSRKKESKRRKPRYSLWLVAAVSVVFLFFAVSYLLARASITINPKTKDVAFNQNLVAVKGASAEGSLSFDVIELSGEENKVVQGGAVADTLIAARGTVLIYNSYSTATQRLDINTRLEGSNGKMYKTEKAVVVPGMKGTTPGSVEVGIYAAEAGEASNSEPLDFQVFGFKGTSKYSKFYARSKGVITGGIKGKVSIIPEAKMAIIVNDMRAILEEKLLAKATGLIPPGSVLFKDSIFLNIESQNFDFASGSEQVPVTVKGTFYGFILDEKELTKKITESSMPDYDGSEVYISNLEILSFTFLEKTGPSIINVQNISFNLSGNPKVVWRFDVDKLIGELAGGSKSNFNQILSKYPNVVSADVVLTP